MSDIAIIYTADMDAAMPRGKTTKCPMCGASMSAMRVKVPRSGAWEYAGTSYFCRSDGTFVIAGPAEQGKFETD